MKNSVQAPGNKALSPSTAQGETLWYSSFRVTVPSGSWVTVRCCVLTDPSRPTEVFPSLEISWAHPTSDRDNDKRGQGPDTHDYTTYLILHEVKMPQGMEYCLSGNTLSLVGTAP